MRILWFTNIPMPAVDKHFHQVTVGSGYWMTSLLADLQHNHGLKLAIVTAQPGLEDVAFSNEGVDYIVIGRHRFAHYDQGTQQELEHCAAVVNNWRPDLVHIHGTESFYGLLGARRMCQVPFLVTIQGLHTEIKRVWRGHLSWAEVVRSQRLIEFSLGYGPIPSYFQTERQAQRQIEIIKGTRYFTGQTFWDESHVWEFNPTAKYFRVGRLLRSSFYEHEWDIGNVRRNRIIFTNARDMIRGTETLIEAVRLLKREFSDISLALAGGGLCRDKGYGKILMERIHKAGLEGNVDVLGFLEPEDLTRALLESHVFTITSLTENESNSLCEAQLLGMPCVASYAGGMPSMINEGSDGLHFPAGDAGVLAYTIRSLLLDDELAVRLGRTARLIAQNRHDKKAVTQRLLNVYQEVTDDYRSSTCH